jgi:LacI family transcriptional regulator
MLEKVDRMATTLLDVARRAQVSKTTASRVLNDKPVIPIAAETAARVRQAAAELCYSPNPAGRALASGRSDTLGLYCANLTDPHFARMLKATEAEAYARNYHLIVSSNLDFVLAQGRIDGCILLGAPDTPGFDTLPSSLPRVFVYNAPELRPNLTGWSDEQGMELAVDHLFFLGHRRLVALFCYGEENYFPPESERTIPCADGTLAQHLKVSGFRRAVARYGVMALELWDASRSDTMVHGNQVRNAYHAVKRLLDAGTPFTAIVARNDFLALGALRALREARIQVPEEVSVVGYTDSVHADFADPPLTSVRTPIAEAGEKAVATLVAALETGQIETPSTLLAASLTHRLTCAPARNG